MSNFKNPITTDSLRQDHGITYSVAPSPVVKLYPDDGHPLACSVPLYAQGIRERLVEVMAKAHPRKGRPSEPSYSAWVRELGVSDKTIKAYVSDPSRLSASQVATICKVAGVSLEWLRRGYVDALFDTTENPFEATSSTSDMLSTKQFAELYDNLGDNGKRTLTSVLKALLEAEQTDLYRQECAELRDESERLG